MVRSPSCWVEALRINSHESSIELILYYMSCGLLFVECLVLVPGNHERQSLGVHVGLNTNALSNFVLWSHCKC